MLIDNSTAESFLRRIKDADGVVVDLETTGLRPYSLHGFRQDRICGVAVLVGGFEKGVAGYFPVAHSHSANVSDEVARDLYKVLAEKKWWKGHNVASFDSKFLIREGCRPPAKVIDTYLGSHIFNENDRHGLKPLSEKYLGHGSALEEKVLSEKLMQWGYSKSEMWRLPASDVAPYACDDVILCDKFDHFLRETMPSDLLKIWAEVDEFSMVILSMSERGLQLDVDELIRLKKEAEIASMEILRSAPRGVNIASPKSVKAFLRTPDTTEATLSRLGTDFAKMVLKYRSWRKAVDSYYEPYLQFMDKSGVLHPQYNIAGTISGRISGNDPNVLAIPVMSPEQKVKQVYIPREGYKLVEVDYSQAELRLAAHYTGDTNVLKAFRDSVDLHQMVADQIKQPRGFAKTINFSIVYGAGADSLAENLGISRKQAQEILYKFHDEFPGYRRLQKKAERTAEDRGYISMWTGRRRHFNCTEAESRKSFSNLIQGGVAEMMRRSMTQVAREMPHCHILLQVYDSLLVEVPEDDAEGHALAIKDILEDQPWCSAPIKVDAKVGNRWSTLRKL